MKRIILIFIVLSIFAGCRKDNGGDSDVRIDGEWELISLTTKSVDMDGTTLNVYIEFAGGRFELYQKLGDGAYYAFTGSYSVVGDELSGQYSDGKAFGAKYNVAIVDDCLELRPVEKNEIQLLKPSSIPASVRQGAIR